MRIHRIGIAILVLSLLAGSLYYASPATGAQPQTISIAQTQTTTVTWAYCCYQQVFLVTEVEVTPKSTKGGASLEVIIEVKYPDGSPVTLRPEVADFLLVGAGYSHAYSRIPLTFTGTPGKYRASITLWADIPVGTYKIYCVHCTLSDGVGNFSPNTDISSDETVIIADLSVFSVGVATTTTVQAPPAGPSLSLLVESGILILLILIAALLALLLRRRKKA